MVTNGTQRRIAGKKFLKLRGDLNLSQEEFAHLLGTSTANVRRIEGLASTTIRPKLFRKLSEVMKLPHEVAALALAADGEDEPNLLQVNLTPYEHKVLTAYAKGVNASPAVAARLLMLESLRTKKEWVKAEGEVKSRGATTPTGSGGTGNSRRTKSRIEGAEDASPPPQPRTDVGNRPSPRGRKSA